MIQQKKENKKKIMHHFTFTQNYQKEIQIFSKVKICINFLLSIVSAQYFKTSVQELTLN